MPQFSPREIRTAVAPMSNPTAKSFSYAAELYLGLPKAASSGAISFSLAAGETRNISFPVTMPDAPGTYPVYLDVFVAGQLLGAYQATEDVIIEAPLVPFTFSNLSASRTRCQSATAWNTLNFGCTITNPTGRSITHILTPMYRVGTKRGYSDPIARPEFARELTLSPGQSYNYYLPGNQPALDRCTILLGFSAGVPYGGCAFLRDENGNDSPQACV